MNRVPIRKRLLELWRSLAIVRFILSYSNIFHHWEYYDVRVRGYRMGDGRDMGVFSVDHRRCTVCGRTQHHVIGVFFMDKMWEWYDGSLKEAVENKKAT